MRTPCQAAVAQPLLFATFLPMLHHHENGANHQPVSAIDMPVRLKVGTWHDVAHPKDIRVGRILVYGQKPSKVPQAVQVSKEYTRLNVAVTGPLFL